MLCLTRIINVNSSQGTYISKISDNSPWIFISYIAGVFYLDENDQSFRSHQNKKEAASMVPILNNLGYNVYVMDCSDTTLKLPKINFSILFGLGSNMTRAVKQYPQAYKVYYGTGAYFEHQNKQIYCLTDAINKKHNSALPYRRLATINNLCQQANEILLIGSKYTAETYPIEVQNKIKFIRQSTQDIIFEGNIDYAKENEFFYMSSSGNVLKGLSLLIDYFSCHPELSLNVVGPIEDDFKEVFNSSITENIKLYGFVDIQSDLFYDITKRCNFIIYPSGSEGMPGAVLNSMKVGMIPIVTRWSAFDEIKEYGYLLQKWDIESIGKGIEWSKMLTENVIISKKLACRSYVLNNHTLDNFMNEFRLFFESLNTK